MFCPPQIPNCLPFGWREGGGGGRGPWLGGFGGVGGVAQGEYLGVP